MASTTLWLQGPDGGPVPSVGRDAWGTFHAFSGVAPCAQGGGTSVEAARSWLLLHPEACQACRQYLVAMSAVGAYPAVPYPLSPSNVSVGAEIGRGSVGDVYEASLALPGALPGLAGVTAGPIAQVAFKKYHTRVEWEYAECVREATELARFTPACPYILRVFGPLVVVGAGDARPEASTVGVVQELTAGPLVDIVSQASMGQKLLLLFQAAVGVACLHAAGITHGGLRGGALLLTEAGQLRVGSGGLFRTRRAVERATLAVAAQSASALSSTPFSSSPSSTTRIKAWSAPELLTRTPHPKCPSTDTYAFGITAWEVVTASSPVGEFDEISGKPPAGWRPALSALPSETPSSVRELLQACWASDAGARPSMAAVARVLGQAAASFVSPTVLAEVSALWDAATTRIRDLRLAVHGEEGAGVRDEAAAPVRSAQSTGLVQLGLEPHAEDHPAQPPVELRPSDAVMSLESVLESEEVEVVVEPTKATTRRTTPAGSGGARAALTSYLKSTATPVKGAILTDDRSRGDEALGGDTRHSDDAPGEEDEEAGQAEAADEPSHVVVQAGRAGAVHTSLATAGRRGVASRPVTRLTESEPAPPAATPPSLLSRAGAGSHTPAQQQRVQATPPPGATPLPVRTVGRVVNLASPTAAPCKPAPLPSAVKSPVTAPGPSSGGAKQKLPVPSPPATNGPRAVITPIYERNPPIWETDSTSPSDIPGDLESLMAPLPPASGRDLLMSVCVPFYSEDGFALRRGVEALALQRSDLRQYWAQCRYGPQQAAAAVRQGATADGSAAPPGVKGWPGLPELHVFAIADGWRKADGSYILSESMLEEVVDIFGDSLDVEELIRLLEPSAAESDGSMDGGEGEGAQGPPDAVLIQFVTHGGASSRPVLAPLSLDVTVGQRMVCRESTPTGAVTNAMEVARNKREVRRRAAEQKRKTAAWSAFLGFGGGSASQQQPSPAGAQAGKASPAAPKKVADGESWEGFMQGKGKDMKEHQKAAAQSPGKGGGGSLLGPRSVLPTWKGRLSQDAAVRITASVDAAVASEEASSALPEQPIFFTLMIKRENGRKHHSHRWFFEAFAPVSRLRSSGRCRYYFATDCGTLYAPYCLAELVHHMETHPVCAASTGHQRIMDKEDQADPVSADGETLAASVLRNVQGYDFESGLCVFNGMHAQAGFLPVVPGPCGMFRAAALSDAIISQVRKICSTEGAQDGLVQGNLKIAEDRILSYLLVLTDQSAPRQRRVGGSAPARGKSAERAAVPGGRVGGGATGTWSGSMELELGKGATAPLLEDDEKEAPTRKRESVAHNNSAGWQTHWVPTTVFFFESESTLKELVLQRRRWLNGTTAGYIWLLRQPALWRGVRAGRGMSWRVLALSLLQVLVFAITFLMPGIVMVTGYLAVSGLLLILDISGVPSAYAAARPLQFLYLGLAVGSYLAHVTYARLGASNFTEWIWSVRVALNATLMLINAVVVVSISVFSVIQPGAVTAAIGVENFEDVQIATAFGVLYACTPFFLGYMHSKASFLTMLSAFPYYYFFAPTILADLFSYSVARTDDLSWGTKSVPGTSKGSAGGGGNQRREAALARVATARRRIAATARQGGAGLSHRATVRALREGQRRNALAKESSQRITNTLATVQTVGSLAIALVNFLLNGVLHHYLLTVGAATAGVSLIVMVASFSFFVPRAVRGSGGETFEEKFWSLVNFVGWVVASGSVGVMWVIGDHTTSLWQIAASTFAAVIAGLIVVVAVRFGSCCSCTCGGARKTHAPVDVQRSRAGGGGAGGRASRGAPESDSEEEDEEGEEGEGDDTEDDDVEEDGGGTRRPTPAKGSYTPPTLR